MPELESAFETPDDPDSRILISQESAASATTGSGRWPASAAGTIVAARRARRRSSSTASACVLKGAQPDGSGFSFANYGNHAYARTMLSEDALDYALHEFRTIENDLLRTMLWESIWYEVEDGRLAPVDYLAFARDHVFFENDQRLVSTVVGRMRTCLSRYLSETQRDQLAPLVEGDLAERVFDSGLDQGMRLLLFRAYPGLVHSEGGCRLLADIVEQKLTPPGITVSTRDRWRALTRLMLLGDSRADSLLARMKSEDSGDEGRRRAFEVECARPDRATKAALFERFFSDEKLPERWVQNGASIFFASEQAALTDEFVQPALARLDWIKANRKIFFLSAWLEAVVRSRTSPAAANEAWQVVENERTAEDVRKKLLVPLHHLEKTILVRERFARN